MGSVLPMRVRLVLPSGAACYSDSVSGLKEKIMLMTKNETPQRFTACAFWQATGTGHVWCLNDGRVIYHDWVADCDPRLYFSCREAAQAAVVAAQEDGRISKGMHVVVSAA
jgi:hypothetical protein